MLIKRQLLVAKELCSEYGIQVSMRLVPSEMNKADRLI